MSQSRKIIEVRFAQRGQEVFSGTLNVAEGVDEHSLQNNLRYMEQYASQRGSLALNLGDATEVSPSVEPSLAQLHRATKKKPVAKKATKKSRR